MKMIFLGPPGAGKGTLAGKAVDILNVPHISTGAIFRSAIAAASPLGLKVKAIIDAGKLVDDETTIGLVKERLAEKDAQNGYILDGFPRTIPQAEALAGFSAVDKVINLEISDTEVIKRLGGRRTCRDCGAIYNIFLGKPKQENICDKCSGEMYIREDDREEAIKNRLDVYREQTAPLIDYYRNKGLILDLDAALGVDVVAENFRKSIQ